MSSCACKSGLKDLLSNLSKGCNLTLEELYLQDNRSLNKAVSELSLLPFECRALKVLDISDCNMRKQSCKKFGENFIRAMLRENKMEVLKWSGDLACSTTFARDFITVFCRTVEDLSNIKEIQMKNIFNKRANRQEMQQIVRDSKARRIKLVLWEPSYSDEDSADADFSEDPSVDEPETEGQEAIDVDPSNLPEGGN